MDVEEARLVLIQKIRQAIDDLDGITEADLRNSLGNLIVELATAVRKAGGRCRDEIKRREAKS